MSGDPQESMSWRQSLKENHVFTGQIKTWFKGLAIASLGSVSYTVSKFKEGEKSRPIFPKIKI